MRDATHNGNIHTDETDYVWLSCEHYGLPDTTYGGLGYHVVYRPLCGDMYTGNELITNEIKAEIRKHYTEIRSREEVDRKAKFEAMLTEISRPVKPSPMDKMICKYCGTVCYGDCRA